MSASLIASSNFSLRPSSAVVMMVPGLSALETLVYFDRGEILKGLSAGVLVGFVVGSIAFGLAAARFISQPEWLRE